MAGRTATVSGSMLSITPLSEMPQRGEEPHEVQWRWKWCREDNCVAVACSPAGLQAMERAAGLAQETLGRLLSPEEYVERWKQTVMRLENPVMFSEWAKDRDLTNGIQFEDQNRSFIMDRSLDVDKKMISIAAPMIVVLSGVHVRGAKMRLDAQRVYNFGKMDYQERITISNGGYSAVEGDFLPGTKSTSFNLSRGSWERELAFFRAQRD